MAPFLASSACRTTLPEDLPPFGYGGRFRYEWKRQQRVDRVLLTFGKGKKGK